MVRLSVIAVLLIGTGCAERGPSTSHLESEPIRHATAVELGRCPFGHTHLKEVPIIYGDLIPSPGLAQKFKDLEVWYGGCVISDRSPSLKVVCPVCGYSYEEDERVWFKSSRDRAAFARPLSKLIAEFPAPRGAVIDYDQKIRDGEVVAERIWYYAEDATPDIGPQVGQYLQQAANVNFEGQVTQYPVGIYLKLQGHLDDGRILTLAQDYPYVRGLAHADFSVARAGYVPRWCEK